MAAGQVGASEAMRSLALPVVMGLWGVGFYGPLSLGLALHVRIWHALAARRASRERLDLEALADTFQ